MLPAVQPVRLGARLNRVQQKYPLDQKLHDRLKIDRYRASERCRRRFVVQTLSKSVLVQGSDKGGAELEQFLRLPQHSVSSELIPGFGRSLVASNTGSYVVSQARMHA